MLSLLITVLVVLLVLGLFFYILNIIPGLPPIAKQIAIVVVCIFGLIWLVSYVMPLAGTPAVHLLR